MKKIHLLLNMKSVVAALILFVLFVGQNAHAINSANLVGTTWWCDFKGGDSMDRTYQVINFGKVGEGSITSVFLSGSNHEIKWMLKDNNILIEVQYYGLLTYRGKFSGDKNFSAIGKTTNGARYSIDCKPR